MRLGRHTNGLSCEFEMQDAMKVWLKNKGLRFKDEMLVKEVNRRADFLVLKNGLTNIEAKCNDFYCMIRQMNDHAKYCDYCFAFIPDYSITPKDFKQLLFKKGYGLIVYNYENKVITEVLEAHHNKPKDKELKWKTVDCIELEYINLEV